MSEQDAREQKESDHQPHCAIMASRDGWEADCTCQPMTVPALADQIAALESGFVEITTRKRKPAPS
jgi:hypothetical protein